MVAIEVKRFAYGHSTIALADDWPSAMVEPNMWRRVDLPAHQPPELHPVKFVLDYKRNGEPPPAGLLGVEYMPGGDRLVIEIPEHDGWDGATIVGPLNKKRTAGWSSDLSQATELGFLAALAPIALFGGSLRLTYAAMDLAGTSPFIVKQQMVPMLIDVLHARLAGHDAPADWTPLGPDGRNPLDLAPQFR